MSLLLSKSKLWYLKIEMPEWLICPHNLLIFEVGRTYMVWLHVFHRARYLGYVHLRLLELFMATHSNFKNLKTYKAGQLKVKVTQ